MVVKTEIVLVAQRREDCDRQESDTFNPDDDKVGYNVTGLEPHTYYTFEVTPINPGGEGETSSTRIRTAEAGNSSL